MTYIDNFTITPRLPFAKKNTYINESKLILNPKLLNSGLATAQLELLYRAYMSLCFNHISCFYISLHWHSNIYFVKESNMDSNSSEYLLNHTTLPSVYYQGNNKDDVNFIDLGLSLRALQPEAYYPSSHGMFILFFHFFQFHLLFLKSFL